MTGRRRYSAGLSLAIRSATFRTAATLRLRQASQRSLQTCNRATTPRLCSGVNNTTGVALVEVYDLSPGASSSLGNISTRSFVQTGEHVMIGGFIVQGTGPKRVIIRAIGPELTQFGIPDALANPRLELHNGSGALIATNDDWQTTILGGIITSNQVSDIQNSGHAPTAASESAIIANLQPGNYTAIVQRCKQHHRSCSGRSLRFELIAASTAA